ARLVATAAAGEAAEQFGEDVALGGLTLLVGPSVVELARAALPPAATETSTKRATARERIEAARIAGLVDLAGVVAGALLIDADDLLGGVDLLEALLGFLVALGGVGMMLLGERAEGLLDLGLAGALRNAQDLIRIAHG